MIFHKRNTWCNTKLLALFMYNVEHKFTDNDTATESKVMSLKCSDVDDPLFGKSNRHGWAAMQNSDKYSFVICYLSVM